MTLDLAHLASASADEFKTLLAGTYEHSPWVAERAFAKDRSRRWRSSSAPSSWS